MSEDVIGDFTGKLLTDDIDQVKPVKGRVLLSHDQLVLVTGSNKTTIILSNIVSVNPGAAADEIKHFFNEAVAVAYKRNNTQHRAIIGGDENTITKFRTILFTLLVGKQTVIATHPAKRGGRVTDVSPKKLLLEITETALKLSRNDKSTHITVESVIGFEHQNKSIRGTDRPTLALDHTAGDTTKTTHISLLSKRKLKFLSQFIRLNYNKVVNDIRDTTVTDSQTQALVSLYSAGGDAPINMIVTDDTTEKQELIQQLTDKELITRKENSLFLTSRGEIVVTEQLESVNQ